MPDSGGSDTVVQRNDPPAYAQPYIQYGMGEAQRQYQGGGPSFYPGQTLAPQSPETLAATGALASRGMTGSPLTQGAQGLAQQTIAGDFLNSNPYLDATFDRAAGKMRSGVDSMFSGAGRYGSGAHQGIMQEGLGGLATDIYGGNYQAERGRMQDAMFGAPALAATDYQDIAAVGQAGQMRDQYGQQQINADRERFDYAQQSPQEQLARYMALISGGTVGGTSTTQQPSQNNLLSQLGGLGLGIGGLGLSAGWF